jgi:tRNA(fMet)-specific endonuclease VapC
MRRYLLDTGIAGDYINRRRGSFEIARERVTRGDRVGIAVPVLAELVYGAENSKSRERNLQSIRIALGAWQLWPFTEEAAWEYGRLFAELRRIGRPMQVVDVMIAATALTLGNCTVVSADSDLTAIPGLRVENWSESVT